MPVYIKPQARKTLDLGYQFLYTVLAEIGGTERNGVFYSLRRVKLAHPDKLDRFTAAARNLAGFIYPGFESRQVRTHFIKSKFHSCKSRK